MDGYRHHVAPHTRLAVRINCKVDCMDISGYEPISYLEIEKLLPFLLQCNCVGVFGVEAHLGNIFSKALDNFCRPVLY
jgi:hypothetical protein